MIDKGPFFEINITLGESSYFFKQKCQKYCEKHFFSSPRPKFIVESSVCLLLKATLWFSL